MPGWKSGHLVESHPTDPDWETCRACLVPVLAELGVSQAQDVADGSTGDSPRTLAVKERWQALFWRARTWSSRRKHLSSCDKQSAETRRMAKSLLDANADSNRKAAAQREDKRRKPDEEEVNVTAVRRSSKVKGGAGGRSAIAAVAAATNSHELPGTAEVAIPTRSPQHLAAQHLQLSSSVRSSSSGSSYGCVPPSLCGHQAVPARPEPI